MMVGPILSTGIRCDPRPPAWFFGPPLRTNVAVTAARRRAWPRPGARSGFAAAACLVNNWRAYLEHRERQKKDSRMRVLKIRPQSFGFRCPAMRGSRRFDRANGSSRAGDEAR